MGFSCSLVHFNGGRNGSVGSVLGFAVLRAAASRVRACCEPLVEDIIALGLAWVLTSCPKTLLDESINRGLVCVHIHSITWTQKVLAFMS